MEERTLDNKDTADARVKTPDVKVVGNPDVWQLVCKASSESEGWMKSTKALNIPGCGCVIQATTQQRNPDGSYTVAEALTFVGGATVTSNNRIRDGRWNSRLLAWFRRLLLGGGNKAKE